MIGRIDIVLGGQFGDEGKGTVAYQIARRYNRHYVGYVRTGGENAEHRFRDQDGHQWCFHILPCAIAVPEARQHGVFVLPNGMTFSLTGLEREMRAISEAPYPPVVVVGRNAGIILPEHIEAGMAAARARGSTYMGVGAAKAAKVRRHGFKVAADHEAAFVRLGIPVVNAVTVLHNLLRSGDILVEGSQGTLLSLDHGIYPYTTSTNCTTAGMLSDAGLPWSQVGEVWMVIKAVPTRVPGKSGPGWASRELTWEEVCRRAGRPYEEITQTPTATGAGGVERPFEFSFPALQYACMLNAPTALALTFVDWFRYEDRGKTRWSDLSRDTRQFIQHIEQQTGVPVRLIRTGPNLEDCIWRNCADG